MRILLGGSYDEDWQDKEMFVKDPLGTEARIIGEAVAEHTGMVLLGTAIGGKRVLDVLRGEQLPRIC